MPTVLGRAGSKLVFFFNRKKRGAFSNRRGHILKTKKSSSYRRANNWKNFQKIEKVESHPVD